MRCTVVQNHLGHFCQFAGVSGWGGREDRQSAISGTDANNAAVSESAINIAKGFLFLNHSEQLFETVEQGHTSSETTDAETEHPD